MSVDNDKIVAPVRMEHPAIASLCIWGVHPMMHRRFFGYFVHNKAAAMQICERMKRIADLLVENHAIVREEFRKMLEMGGDTEVIRCAKPI